MFTGLRPGEIQYSAKITLASQKVKVGISQHAHFIGVLRGKAGYRVCHSDDRRN